MPTKTTCRIFFFSLIVLLAGCARPYDIRPIPAFIVTGVKAGDRLIITRKSEPEPVRVKVFAVEPDSLVADAGVIQYSDIESIKKISAQKPDYPCGNDQPLGCSVPLLARLTEPGYGKYSNHFYESCVQHDFCYRHGYATYGHDQETCDQEFLNNMLSQCEQPDQRSWSQKLINEDSKAGPCSEIAQSMYEGVRLFGANDFQTHRSTFCAYDG